MSNVAWGVEIHDGNAIVFAETKAKARWIAVKAYWDAYGRNGWPRAVAWREPRFDQSALKDKEQRAWTRDYVEGYPV
jgi:hypothetical protein